MIKLVQQCPRGGQNRSRGAPWRGSENQVVNKQSPAKNTGANGSKFGTKIRKIVILLLIFSMFFLYYVLEWFLNRFFDGFSLDVNIIFIIYLDILS